MRRIFLGLFLLALTPVAPLSAQNPAPAPVDLRAALDGLLGGDESRASALRRLEANWDPRWTVPLVDTLRVAEVLPPFRSRRTRADIAALLDRKAGAHFGLDIGAWFRWIWNSGLTPPAKYADLKAQLYRRIDPRFAEYFSSRETALIRLEEVRWGGVLRDGIPPLRRPKLTPASAASEMDADDVVFGVFINGEAHAYPKRILAWHELVTDLVGGVDIAGVYCTLCGSMIVYETKVGGRRYDLGTSGFLYRSNKLMYDRRTRSLWSTIEGRPVIGSLAVPDSKAGAKPRREIRLKRRPVVTTTWGAWRARHPRTRVLSFETGHDRDYGEGVAYRAYFGTDDLMFEVPGRDTRLKNKDEVLTFAPTRPDGLDALAVATDFLSRRPVYAIRHARRDLVILTDPSGASRVYRAPASPVASWNGRDRATTRDGTPLRVDEEGLHPASGPRLDRVAAHRAFWFGWHAAHPQTGLVRERRPAAPSPAGKH